MTSTAQALLNHPSDVDGALADAAVAAQMEAPVRGHFGDFGGQFVPETLMVALRELEHVYEEARDDPGVSG